MSCSCWCLHRFSLLFFFFFMCACDSCLLVGQPINQSIDRPSIMLCLSTQQQCSLCHAHDADIVVFMIMTIATPSLCCIDRSCNWSSINWSIDQTITSACWSARHSCTHQHHHHATGNIVALLAAAACSCCQHHYYATSGSIIMLLVASSYC